MARKSTCRKTDTLSTGIALGERLASLEHAFKNLDQSIRRRVQVLVLLAASAVLQTVGVPLSEKIGAVFRELGSIFLRVM